MRRKTKVINGCRVRDVSTQTERYVDYMPLPLIIDIKSEAESSDESEQWHEEIHLIESEVKIEIEETRLNDGDERLLDPYSVPVDRKYYKDEPVEPVDNQKKASCDVVKAEQVARKRKPKTQNEPKRKKPKKEKEREEKWPNESTELKLVECSLCKFTCKRPAHLKRHMLMHTGEKPHQCSDCPKSFAQKTDLNRHLFVHAALYNFHCDSCGRGFLTEIESQTHSTNCKIKRYICNECQYMTFSIGNLQLHQRKHTGERPFQCDVCEMRFTRVAHLNQHVKRHADNFEYHCTMCGRGYANVDEMQQHQKTCKNKQFQCHICRDIHLRMDNLKRHIKSAHLGEKEILCEHCSKQFLTKSDLTKHIQRRHPERQ